MAMMHAGLQEMIKALQPNRRSRSAYGMGHDANGAAAIVDRSPAELRRPRGVIGR